MMSFWTRTLDKDTSSIHTFSNSLSGTSSFAWMRCRTWLIGSFYTVSRTENRTTQNVLLLQVIKYKVAICSSQNIQQQQPTLRTYHNTHVFYPQEKWDSKCRKYFLQQTSPPQMTQRMQQSMQPGFLIYTNWSNTITDRVVNNNFWKYWEYQYLI